MPKFTGKRTRAEPPHRWRARQHIGCELFRERKHTLIRPCFLLIVFCYDWASPGLDLDELYGRSSGKNFCVDPCPPQGPGRRADRAHRPRKKGGQVARGRSRCAARLRTPVREHRFCGVPPPIMKSFNDSHQQAQHRKEWHGGKWDKQSWHKTQWPWRLARAPWYRQDIASTQTPSCTVWEAGGARLRVSDMEIGSSERPRYPRGSCRRP